MSWTVSNLQRPFREGFSLQKSGIIAEKGAQIFGHRFVGFDRPKKAAPFSISKRALAAASEIAGRRRPLRPYFFTTGGSLTSVIVADYPEDGETTIPAELQYVEIISVTASTGYDANTGEAKGDEKKLPSTVTFLVLPERTRCWRSWSRSPSSIWLSSTAARQMAQGSSLRRRTRSLRSCTQRRRKPHNLVTFKRNSCLAVLGLLERQNEYSTPPFTQKQVVELLDGLRQIAPYVIVDCGSYIANDILSAVALIHCIKTLHAICSFALSK